MVSSGAPERRRRERENGMRLVLFVCCAATIFASTSCSVDGGDRSYSDADGDSDGGTDSDADGDSDGDTDTNPGGSGTIRGTVMAPNGALPISGALVYVTSGNAPPIDDGVYCYECDDMTGKKWTLSEPDGTWQIEDVPAGTHTLVTRKGFFRRQRAIDVVADATTDVPVETTTMPADDSADGLDEIPHFAVLLNEWDMQHDLLAKLGMGTLDGSGNLVFGSESFDIYQDDVSQTGYPLSADLFADEATIGQYHMLFFPCTSSYNGVSFVTSHATMLQAYVGAGGRLYSSCCTALWNVAPFPGYIDYSGDDTPNTFDIGRISSSAYSTTGQVNDDAMATWLELVSGQPSNAFPFTDGYVKIDALNTVADGHGLDTDGGAVIPKAWVTDNQAYPGSPLIVTYNWECGKTFYSVYETSHVASAAIQPQEYVLLYVILEVGVCQGSYIPPE
jgi:hypothetical protein